ncbi:MAG TPA: sulfurtransferase [Burkholderiaceae bacterium]|nr:sulfurtransferase [Burkholderiaceae bacterium]
MSYTTLISAQQLQEHLADPACKIFDLRHDLMDHGAGLRAYEAGHIPGARFAAIETELSGTKTGRNGRHPLPERDDLVERFRAWGIDDSTQIVAYDAQGGQYAVRLWWLARWLGHPAVAVLDGGWPAWLTAGGATDLSRPAAVPRGSFTAAPSLVHVATATEVLQSLGGTEHLVVDARLPERYRGEQEPIDPVAGHIPGALNRPWTTNLTPDQHFKSPGELRREFDGLIGARDPATVTYHCGSGVTACHHVLAMELAGLATPKLYAGSWSEWIADPSRAVRTGAAP